MVPVIVPVVVVAGSVLYIVYETVFGGKIKGWGLSKPIAKTIGGNPVFKAATDPLSVAGGVNPVTGQPKAPGTPSFAESVATSGIAVGPAHALHDYLKLHKYDHTAQYKNLVIAFQAATSGDLLATALHGPLRVSGDYDLDTSAALTVYTGNPIPPDPSLKPQPDATPQQVLSTPGYVGNAAKSGFNLQQYLKVHNNDKSETLKTLVKSFQHDVNNDPQFPGPKSVGVKIIKTPLAEDGAYGPATAKALGVYGGVPK